MNVLSLFDGMSCGQIALERTGICIENYFASEIDKYAMKVTKANYPDTQHIGSVVDIKGEDLPKINLLIGGSPCQGFSFAGKGLNFDDPRSALFFEFVRIKKECRPRYFLLENVGMKQEHQDVITELLGVKPIFINSRDFSAQDRKRLYWTNIKIQRYTPKDVGFDSIVDGGGYAGAMRGRRINSLGKRDDYNKEIPLVQHIESRKDNKTNCLSTVGKDNVVSTEKVGRTPLTQCEWRYLKVVEAERLQTVQEGYTASVSNNQAMKMLGNGWTVDVVAHIFKGMNGLDLARG